MEYPKKIMRFNELVDMGFPKEMLLKICSDKDQTIAFKNNPTKRNSPFLFDTDGLEQYRLNLVRRSRSFSRGK